MEVIFSRAMRLTGQQHFEVRAEDSEVRKGSEGIMDGQRDQRVDVFLLEGMESVVGEEVE